MAAFTLIASVASSTDNTDRVLSPTVAVGDLIIVVVSVSGISSFTNVFVEDDAGGSYTLISGSSHVQGTSVCGLFVRNSLISTAETIFLTVDFTTNGVTHTGCAVAAFKVTGMPSSNVGSAAIRQVGTQGNTASGTPTVTMPSAFLTGNAGIAYFHTATVSETLPPSGWTEQFDAGYISPNRRMEVATRNSGETSDTITWGESETLFSAGVAELDTKVSIATGRANETDTALRLAMTHAVNRAAETDTSLALTRKLIRATGLATSANTAFALGGNFTAAVGRADSVDTALALEQKQLRATGRADEADLAAQLTTALPVRRLDETDTAFRVAMTLGVTLAHEDNTAFALSNLGVRTALETDTAIELGQNLTVGIASETDTAAELGHKHIKAVTLAFESNVALDLTGVLQVAIGFEIDNAFALPKVFIRSTEAADETDLALICNPVQVRPVGFTAETDLAVARAYAALLQLSSETDTAFPLTLFVTLMTGMAEETDTALRQFGALSAAAGNAPEVDLRNLLRERVQPVHDATRYA